MFTIRRTTIDTELLHWLLVILAAVALLLLLATALAADPMGPAALPPTVKLAAGQSLRPFFPEHPPMPERVAAEAAERLWMTFEHQRAGCYAEALAGWEGIRLPHETAVWKEIGMAAALLRMEDLPQALARLERAEQIAPHHPLAAYYRGLVWMRQAERLPAEGYGDRFPAAATPAVERAVYELMAIDDLTEAIERAMVVEMDEPLVPVARAAGRPMAGPQVRDLLAALEAEQFVGDAHFQIYRLHLGRREFADAEDHLHRAVQGGKAAADDLLGLAEALLEAGHRTDAFRVLHEAVALDQPWIDRVCGRIQAWLLAKQPAQWV